MAGRITELTKKDVFVTEYVKDFNGTKAAITAGYSPATASQAASRLLRDVTIASRIEEFRKKAIIEGGYSIKYVLDNLNEVAQRCMQKRPVMKWDYKAKEMVQVTDEEGRDVWAFDSQGANRALELLGKNAGAFEVDNNQKRPVIAIKLGD